MNNQVFQQLLFFAVPIAIFYFIFWRPQQQQKKRHEDALLSIKKGDEIVTSGGLIGEVIFIKVGKSDGAASLEDRVTIKSGESRVIVERGRIARVSSGTATASAPAKSSASATAT
jgi:preprotein translocase subunit YajC